MDQIQKAVDELRKGNLVVVPTETVYGLAGLALDEQAILKIFAAKKRPPEHPLIVHVHRWEEVSKFAHTNAIAKKLAHEFWPGPLTLLLQKKDSVPYAVTGGLETVAVRSPNHIVTLQILEALGEPIAAPSANIFTELSPVNPAMLSEHIRAAAAVVVDGGPCKSGIESTIIDCTLSPPVLLRPGPIPASVIEAVLGYALGLRENSASKAPGSHERHYRPPFRIVIVQMADADQWALTLHDAPQTSQKLHTSMPSDPASYAEVLYTRIFEHTAQKLEELHIEAPPKTTEWDAVWDRLNRMSS